MRMEMYTKDNGLMIKLMNMENIFILIILYFKEIGRKINRMDLVNNIGQIILNFKVNM